jgi:molybdopterin synthase sulfur carrier subunit
VIRVVLPAHLRTLARVAGEVELDVKGVATQRSVLDALEAKYPMLCGTLRDHGTQQRRPFVRFFASEQDLSHDPPDTPLPDVVASGAEPFLIVGAIAGGKGRVSNPPGRALRFSLHHFECKVADQSDTWRKECPVAAELLAGIGIGG